MQYQRRSERPLPKPPRDRGSKVQKKGRPGRRRPTVDDLSLSLDASPVQLDARAGAVERFWSALSERDQSERRSVQRRADARARASQVQDAASRGIEGAARPLPHREQIQASFGPDHDVSAIQAHVGGAASQACQDMHAHGYASGNHVAFASSPSLALAAHEAAHVVQQRSGAVQLAGGVGEVGDRWEQHADAVAARVVAGQSAADLLAGARGAGSAALQQRAVQRDEKDAKEGSGAAPEAVPLPKQPDPFGAGGSSKSDNPGGELKLEKEFKIDKSVGPWPIKLSAIKIAAKAVAKGQGGDSKVTSGQAAGAKGYKSAVEMEQKLFDTVVDVKLKGTTADTDGKPKGSLVVGGKFVDFELSGKLDPEKPVSLSAKVKLGNIIRELADFQEYNWVDGPDVTLEFVPDPAGAGAAAAGLAAGAIGGPVAIAFLVYEMGKGYLKAIGDANLRGKIEAVRHKFAAGAQRALANLTESPPDTSGLKHGSWSNTVEIALLEVQRTRQLPGNMSEIEDAGEWAVYGDFEANASTPEKKQAFAAKVKKWAGYADGANHPTRNSVIGTKLLAQAKGDGPIGVTT